MHIYKDIAVIGTTGNMRSAICKGLSKSNYHLICCANELDKAHSLVQEIKTENPFADVDISISELEASWEADIIILAVPHQAEKELANKIKEVANQKIVISIANPLNYFYKGWLTSPETSAAEELQKLLPNSKVIRAFNTTFAVNFPTPVINGRQVDVYIAGNDKEGLKTVGELLSEAGFNPHIAGDLSVSRTLEKMQLLFNRLGGGNYRNYEHLRDEHLIVFN